jgi:hypothetical protein
VTTTGFVILVVLVLLAVLVYVELAKLPGKKARDRGHPQAEAIAVLSWVGLLLGVVPWVVALVWAHTDPHGSRVRAEPAAPPTPAAPEDADSQ